MPDSSRSEWANVGIAAVALLSLAFGGYGHFSGVMAEQQAKVRVLEKESMVSIKDRAEMSNELDMLWLDTSRNKDGLVVIEKDLSRFNASFEKFADAVDRLSISVVRLEVGMNNKKGVKKDE